MFWKSLQYRLFVAVIYVNSTRTYFDEKILYAVKILLLVWVLIVNYHVHMGPPLALTLCQMCYPTPSYIISPSILILSSYLRIDICPKWFDPSGFTVKMLYEFLISLIFTTAPFHVREPGYLSQYSVWLRTGRSGDRGSIPGRGKMIFPPISVSRPALVHTQPLVQWVPWSFPRGKARPGREADHSPPSSIEVVNE
jgi:hypothetical protein